ncbi:hypothetical protein KC865_02250 [Candidatus Kaiserbacteria bacterium]|nr:hypothetical protein [Candidatus Kaiserbacteria bacterium]USN92390.1 MAG: hypothetical protein H6782_01080 [Candidatus Nomurabacteria bacterium]
MRLLQKYIRASKYWGYLKARKLPPIPTTIKPLPYNADGQVKAMVVAGLSLIGEQGCVCPTVSVIGSDQETGEIFGWSLCLGNPNSHSKDQLHYFRTSSDEKVGTAEGTEWPNVMVYFQAEVSKELVRADANPDELHKVIAYVMPYINDVGPPPSTGKSFAELVSETPTSIAEHEDAVDLKSKILTVLNSARSEITGYWSDWDLVKEINKRLHKSGIRHAWKSNPSGPDYNPDLGIIEMKIAGRLFRVSIGLSKDRFSGPCAVVQLIDF